MKHQKYEKNKISYIILIKTTRERADKDIAKGIEEKKIPSLLAIGEVIGPYDLAVVISKDFNKKALNREIIDKIKEVKGVAETCTLSFDPVLPSLLEEDNLNLKIPLVSVLMLSVVTFLAKIIFNLPAEIVAPSLVLFCVALAWKTFRQSRQSENGN